MMDLVRIEGDRAVADSRDVAAQFDKRHDHVLRSIDKLLEEDQGLLSNFGLQQFPVDQGGGRLRYYRRFDMDRKGFMLLVMGFTGAKALTLKSQWIDAFDAMEQALRGGAPMLEDDGAEDAPLTLEDVRERLNFVREARLLGGRAAGRRAWKMAHLPDVFNADVPVFAQLSGDVAPDIEAWLAARTVPSEERVSARALYADYLRWCRAEELTPRSSTAFGRGLSAKGIGKMKGNGGTIQRKGLSLVSGVQ